MIVQLFSSKPEAYDPGVFVDDESDYATDISIIRPLSINNRVISSLRWIRF
jgi:hypothetical protein